MHLQTLELDFTYSFPVSVSKVELIPMSVSSQPESEQCTYLGNRYAPPYQPTSPSEWSSLVILGTACGKILSGKRLPVWKRNSYRGKDRCVEQHEETHETYGSHDGEELDSSNPFVLFFHLALFGRLLVEVLGRYLFKVIRCTGRDFLLFFVLLFEGRLRKGKP